MTRKKKKSFFAPLVALLPACATLWACSTSTIYDTFVHTPLSGWEKNDTLSFSIPPVAESGEYEESIGLRMTGEYPFTSISLITDQMILPDGKTIADTIKCHITDERGNFLGGGVSVFQYSFQLRDISLQRGDSIHITIRHNMKREILPGVSDIGIQINKLK